MIQPTSCSYNARKSKIAHWPKQLTMTSHRDLRTVWALPAPGHCEAQTKVQAWAVPCLGRLGLFSWWRKWPVWSPAGAAASSMLYINSLTPRRSERQASRQANGIVVCLLCARRSARPWTAISHLIIARVLHCIGVGILWGFVSVCLFVSEEESDAWKLTKVTSSEGFWVSTKKSPISDLRRGPGW